MRKTISVRGAREHNLRDLSIELPRDSLTVVTGVSGSGKSSLVFDTLYAEGQRRYLDSLSSFLRQFLDQLERPDVDFIDGLSPVVSIEQKTVSRNPRSTVGTLTDIGNFLNLLYAASAQAHCPHCHAPVATRSRGQLVEAVLSQPEGTRVELRVPVWSAYGEDGEFLLTELRRKGCRYVWRDGQCEDLSELTSLDPEDLGDAAAVADRLFVKAGSEQQVALAVEHALEIGERFISLWVAVEGAEPRPVSGVGCERHGWCAGGLEAAHFMFNQPASACRTCLGLGTFRQAHVPLMVPDDTRSIRGGCFVPQAYRYDPDTYNGILMWSLSQRYGFSVDTPWRDLAPEVQHVILHGTGGEQIAAIPPPDSKDRFGITGRMFRYDGIATWIERHYRRLREQATAESQMDNHLAKVMVDHVCPDCNGARLRPQRLLHEIDGRDIAAVGLLPFDDLHAWLSSVELPRNPNAGRPVRAEILARLDLLLGIGLDYLSFARASATLSGGEAQRIRLSTQIGSGLMGMLYVLDEPSIGLHPKDNDKMIATLRRLRDLGNTVIVVEHDEDTIRAADHVVELGPGAGVHGGELVAQGTLQEILDHPTAVTGHFLSGRRRIPLPTKRRGPTKEALVVRGARENNLQRLDVRIPLGRFVCLTGASGSGKSTLATDILFNRLYAHFHDSRQLSGAHDRIDGLELLSDVVAIDQTAIGRSSRSNPATYVGFYDAIRTLFAAQPLSEERKYTAGRFSFNVKGGRCEECQGGGTVTTHLHFMPDIEVRCEVCRGARFNDETLAVTYRGRNIAEVLAMSFEEAQEYFANQPTIQRKVALVCDLGLGYLTLGQSSTTLSGGEAQRIKLALQLSKLRRGKQVLYILDEPTTGLHLADIERLLDCLERLVAAGHTVLCIEHHLDVIKTADWVIDLGPGGGYQGGLIVAEGTPEEIAACEASHTGRYLRPLLERSALNGAAKPAASRSRSRRG